MSFNLLDAAKGLFTNELIGKASAYLGERESGVAKAISSILPTVLGSFSEKAATTSGANDLANMVNDQRKSGSHMNLNSFFSNDGGAILNKGAAVTEGLFGNKLGTLTNSISDYAGIKQTSVSSLFSMAVPAVLGLVGKLGLNNHNGNIPAVFEGQKNNILSAIPAGLNVSGILNGVGNKVSDIASSVNATTHYVGETVKRKSALGWLLPLLLLALLAMAAWYFLGKGCKSEDPKAAAEEVQADANISLGKLDSLSGEWMYNEGDTITISLPNNGGDITVGKYSTEARLVKFLKDKDIALDTVKGNWFEFTNVHFKTGSAEITEGSKQQLLNMATICKAFDKAQFKLGGYTDSTGSVATNIEVSQKRADAVLGFLKKAGVAETSFTGAKGFGPEWPIASNATAEGRAQNRRVAVNVKAK